MQQTKFTESQIVAAIKKQESGVSTREVCRELGCPKQHFINEKPAMVVWKSGQSLLNFYYIDYQ